MDLLNLGGTAAHAPRHHRGLESVIKTLTQYVLTVNTVSERLLLGERDVHPEKASKYCSNLKCQRSV